MAEPLTPAAEARMRSELAEVLASEKYKISYTLVIHELAGIGEDADSLFATLDAERAAHAQTRAKLQAAAVDAVDETQAQVDKAKRELAEARAQWDKERARLVAALTEEKKLSKTATSAWRAKMNEGLKLVALLRKCIGEPAEGPNGMATDGLYELAVEAMRAPSGSSEERCAIAAADAIIDEVRAAIDPKTNDDEKPPKDPA